MSVRIAGGMVVTGEGVRHADILVEGELVLDVSASRSRAEAALDARGCYVLPGGVDPHTHLLTDITAATRSAAFGGTTTAISFTLPRPEESLAGAVERARDELVPLAAVDVALHAYVSEPDRLTPTDVNEVAALGVTGVKLFTAYRELGLQASDRTVYETMRAAARLGLPVLIHCENGGLIEALVRELVAAGGRDAACFARSRPPEAEVEAVSRVLGFAGLADARVYIVHLSTGGALKHVREARRRGVAVGAEACIHHLALDDSTYEGADAGRYLTVPPLRSPEHVEALWNAVGDGTLDAVGSDHSQRRYQPPPSDDFTGLPYGLAGVEARLPLLLSLGLERGVSIERLVHLASAGPARAFGLYPRKGTIAPGSDADLVVWDPADEWTIGRASLHDGLETPYEGLRVHGRIRSVFLRGEPIVEDGALVADSRGRYATAPGTKTALPVSAAT